MNDQKDRKSNTFANVYNLTLQNTKKAKEAMKQVKPEIKRTTIKQGIMEAVVYAQTGALLLKTDSGSSVALMYEEAIALRDLLNRELPNKDKTQEDGENHG